MSFLLYRRPPEVQPQEGHLCECKHGDIESGKGTIPPELSFESVICNKCSPPCSLQDFLEYLTYVSHDAENLQFYLWMIDYFQRFRRVPKMERALSPRWTGRAPPIKEQNGLRMIATHDIDIMSEDISDCDTWGGYEVSEFTDQYTQTLDDIKFSISPVKPNRPDQYVWHPAEAQPLRSEITRIINHYLAPGSPRQLNLSHNDRATVLRALEYTTHPSALSPIKKMLDSTLRNQSHPNFIRHSLCNGSRPYVRSLLILGGTSALIGFLLAILLLLSHANRFLRLFALPFWWFGIYNLITASRGLCGILLSLHARQSHEWETKPPSTSNPNPKRKPKSKPSLSNLTASSSKSRFSPRSRSKTGELWRLDNGNGYNNNDDTQMLKTDFSTIMGQGGAISYESTRPSYPVKMEVFGPANNYSGESWVWQHREKPWWRKVFEHRVRVQEAGLRKIQTRMTRQAQVWALLGAVPLTVLFVALPGANVI